MDVRLGFVDDRLPQKFIVGLDASGFIYCARYKYPEASGEPADHQAEEVAHRIIAREFGFDLTLDKSKLDVFGAGYVRLGERGKLSFTGSSGAYGSVPFPLLSKFGSLLFDRYTSMFQGVKRVELVNRDDLVDPKVMEKFFELRRSLR